MKLYKYVSPERIDILLNGKIRFSQAEVWNDPFELQPYYEDQTEKDPLKQFAEYGKLIKDYKSSGISPTEDQINNLEKERKRITKDDIYRYLNKKIVALSLTEDRENLLMWSHYANNNTGFVIELDINTNFFKNNDRYLHKIEYVRNRYEVKTDMFAILIIKLIKHLNEEKEISKDLKEDLSKIFRKGLDWKDENEWRLITVVEKADNFKSFEEDLKFIHIGLDYNETYHIALFTLPLETISAIYIGERAPNYLKRKLYLLTKYNCLYSHIKIISTKIDNQEFKLNYEEVSRWDILTAGEIEVDIDKTTKWQRFINPFLCSYYKEILNIKKVNPANSDL